MSSKQPESSERKKSVWLRKHEA